MKAHSDIQKKARALVADDHAFVRIGIIAVLAADSGLTVVWARPRTARRQ